MGNFSMHYPIIEGPFAPGASGNICTEDLVHMFDAMGFDTGVDLEALLDWARCMPALVEHDVPGMKACPPQKLDPTNSD